MQFKYTPYCVLNKFNEVNDYIYMFDLHFLDFTYLWTSSRWPLLFLSNSGELNKVFLDFHTYNIQ